MKIKVTSYNIICREICREFGLWGCTIWVKKTETQFRLGYFETVDIVSEGELSNHDFEISKIVMEHKELVNFDGLYKTPKDIGIIGIPMLGNGGASFFITGMGKKIKESIKKNR
ncbi:MAG: hypothetical protein CVU89_06445 [Firmicutes bacterium HGW-Firmicutes-14]|nr:MAG: hypothetical protein CVU89_06445 [Firmicutes bacterium HGW-Firmicutes-14]